MGKSNKRVAAEKEKKSNGKAGVKAGWAIISIGIFVVFLNALINKNAQLSTFFEFESIGVAIIAIGITVLFHGYAQEQAKKTEILLKGIKSTLEDIRSKL